MYYLTLSLTVIDNGEDQVSDSLRLATITFRKIIFIVRMLF